MAGWHDCRISRMAAVTSEHGRTQANKSSCAYTGSTKGTTVRGRHVRIVKQSLHPKASTQASQPIH